MLFLEKDVPVLTAYEKDGLKIIFSLNKAVDSNVLAINVVATNETLSSVITDFLFQAAVPKVSHNTISYRFYLLPNCRQVGNCCLSFVSSCYQILFI